ncbi:MAG: metal-sulfur cluster assembly factor [Proteobacteria bacterium]|nr:metal-sulfur cluster assembly factor [Pseudomonadota bacterium]
MDAKPDAGGDLPPPELPFPYHGPDALRQPVHHALRRVADPEVAMNIVDVGLVYGVEVEDQRLRLLLTMTSAACPVADVIVDDCQTELARVLPDGMAVDVELVWEPPWTPDRLSARARALMGW